jgi:hypothetical protein
MRLQNSDQFCRKPHFSTTRRTNGARELIIFIIADVSNTLPQMLRWE